ncbi:unnamed protein product, partial [Ectocarpus fasciculatus]
ILLKEIGRDCLRDTNSIDEKVQVLVGVILPEAERKSVSTFHGVEENTTHAPSSASSSRPTSVKLHAAANGRGDSDAAAKNVAD